MADNIEGPQKKPTMADSTHEPREEPAMADNADEPHDNNKATDNSDKPQEETERTGSARRVKAKRKQAVEMVDKATVTDYIESLREEHAALQKRRLERAADPNIYHSRPLFLTTPRSPRPTSASSSVHDKATYTTEDFPSLSDFPESHHPAEILEDSRPKTADSRPKTTESRRSRRSRSRDGSGRTGSPRATRVTFMEDDTSGRRETSASPTRPGSSRVGSAKNERGASSSPQRRGRSKSPKGRESSATSNKDKAGSRSTSGKKRSGSSGEGRRSGRNRRDARGLRILDFSNQGLTTVPPALLSIMNSEMEGEEIGEMDLSGNNLRTIPAEVKNLTQLARLDICRNGLRCLSNNDFGGLPRDMAQLKHLTELQISECNLMFVPPVVWRLSALTKLNLSRNKIQMLYPEVGQLTKLQHLNLQQTAITSLPPEIALCQELTELLLWGNTIDSLPDTLKVMPKLRIVAINCRSFAKVVDDYMQRLLKSGQIQSEHVPAVYWQLPALQVADLESCKLNYVPPESLPAVRELYIASNFFQVLPEAVLDMKCLQILDLANNTLSELPERLNAMTGLTTLRLGNNNIETIPETIGDLKELKELDMTKNKVNELPNSIGKLSKLKTLALSRNQIRLLPESICELEAIETLDLSDNQLRQIPLALHRLTALRGAHAYSKLHRVGLWLHGNPIHQPPPEVWRTNDPTKIFHYLKRLAIMRTENLQPLKVVVLGGHQSGKSSLVRTLVQGRSCLTQHEEDATRILEQNHLKTENKVQFNFFELGGHDSYAPLWPLFLDAQALVLLVVDLDAIDSLMMTFEAAVGTWLDLLALHCPGVCVLLVPTKADLFPEDYELHELTQSLWNQAQEHVAALRARLEELLRQVKDALQVKVSKQLKAQEKRLQQVLEREPVRLAPMADTCSAGEACGGLTDLLSQMETLAVDKAWFPHAQKYVPHPWNTLAQRLKNEADACLTLQQVRDVVASEHLINSSQLEECLEHHHACGSLVRLRHWQGEPGGAIIPRPRNLVKILRGLFRHDMPSFMDYYENKVFSSRGGYSEEMFDEARPLLLEGGQVPRPLLHCLWFELGLDNAALNGLLDLMPQLGLAYRVPEPDVPDGSNHAVPLLVFPSQVTYGPPANLADMWPRDPPAGWCHLERHWELHGVLPRFLLADVSVNIHEQLDQRLDWQGGVLGWLPESSGMLLLTLEQPEGSPATVSLCARAGGDGEATTRAKELVSTVATEIEEALQRLPGCVWQSALRSSLMTQPTTDIAS